MEYNNLQIFKTNLLNNYPFLLQSKKTGEVISPDEADKRINKKRFKLSIYTGAVTGSICSEIRNFNKDIPKTKIIKNRILGPIWGATAFLGFSVLTANQEKISKNLGISNQKDKVYSYCKNGYNIIKTNNDPLMDKLKDDKVSKAIKIGFPIAGASFGVLKGVKGEKIRLPVIEWAETKNKATDSLVNGLGNGLTYGIIGDTSDKVIHKTKTKKTDIS